MRTLLQFSLSAVPTAQHTGNIQTWASAQNLVPIWHKSLLYIVKVCLKRKMKYVNNMLTSHYNAPNNIKNNRKNKNNDKRVIGIAQLC